MGVKIENPLYTNINNISNGETDGKENLFKQYTY